MYYPFSNKDILEEFFLKEAFKLVLQAFKKTSYKSSLL